jgi:hypothetical protein
MASPLQPALAGSLGFNHNKIPSTFGDRTSKSSI